MFLLFIALLNTCLLITCYILFQFFLFGVNALFCFTCIKGLIFFAYIICILYFSVLKSTFYPRTSSAFRLFAICSLLCTPEWHLHFGFSQFEVYFAPQNGICISAFRNLKSTLRPRMASAFRLFSSCGLFRAQYGYPRTKWKTDCLNLHNLFNLIPIKYVFFLYI